MQTSKGKQNYPWTPVKYFTALHPPSSAGAVMLMSLSQGRDAFARTYDAAEAAAVMPNWLDLSAYCSINRFRGPRGRGRLAALNAL